MIRIRICPLDLTYEAPDLIARTLKVTIIVRVDYVVGRQLDSFVASHELYK